MKGYLPQNYFCLANAERYMKEKKKKKSAGSDLALIPVMNGATRGKVEESIHPPTHPPIHSLFIQAKFSTYMRLLHYSSNVYTFKN